MGKYAKYKKKYKKEWENLKQFKEWLQKCEEEDDMAYCNVCRSKLRPHKTDLERHASRQLHKNNFTKSNPAISKQSTLEPLVLRDEGKESEIVLSACVALHGTIRSVDHLSCIVKKQFGKNTSAENLKLHRTKCCMIIKNVIAKSLKEELIKRIGDSYYSLIIDESTDVSMFKYMCLSVRYFEKGIGKIVTNYLGIIEVERATAEILSEGIQNFLKQIGLDINMLNGIGTDGASNLCGVNHSVYTILNDVVPRLQLVKCIAHSLHLCSSTAAESLPASLDFLCKELYNWFSNSPLRLATYKHIFDLVNCGPDENNKQLRLVKLSATRWLARTNVMKVILQQWTELKGYFNIIVNSERSYMAKTLLNMLEDNVHYLYLTAIYGTLKEVNRINLIFQRDNTDIFKAYLELYKLLLTLLRMIVKPIWLENLAELCHKNFKTILQILDNQLVLLPVEIIDFGYSFREASHEYKVSPESLLNIKKTCRNFILVLCREITNRMPSNIKLIEAVKYFSPDYCLDSKNHPNFEQLPLFLVDRKKMDITNLELQWNSLLSHEWKVRDNVSSESFWVMAYNYQDAGQEFSYRDIAKFALMVLSLPLSNAIVERVFSSMNIIKTKIRNKISFSLLDSLLRIKTDFTVRNICCESFTPTKEMFQKFNVNMYDHKTSSTNNNETDDDKCVIETFEVFDEI